MSRFNWESFAGAVMAASMFGYAYGQAVPENYRWWVPVLFGVGMAMTRGR